MNEYEIIATRRYKGHVIEFRKTEFGTIYASVTRKGIYLTDAEHPYDVSLYIASKLMNYFEHGKPL